jgi:hypothetical protein
MRSKSQIAFVVVAALWIAANVASLGCAIVPLPPTHHPIDARKKADFKFVKKSQPTRDEVIAKLGQPDAYLNDLNVACYRINSVTHRKTLLLFFVIPTPPEKTYDFDLALIEFDATGRATRYGLVRQPTYQGYGDAAKAWLVSQEKKPGKP